MELSIERELAGKKDFCPTGGLTRRHRPAFRGISGRSFAVAARIVAAWQPILKVEQA
jgi:hypothetical protein